MKKLLFLNLMALALGSLSFESLALGGGRKPAAKRAAPAAKRAAPAAKRVAPAAVAEAPPTLKYY